MRILVLSDRIPPENAGGAEKVAWTFAQGLALRGHDVTVLAATSSAAFTDERSGIPVHHIHARWRPRFTAYWSLYHPGVAAQVAAKLDALRPELVLAFNVHTGLTYHSLTLAKRRGIPVIHHLQDAMTFTYGKLVHFATPEARCPIESEQYRLPPLYNLRTYRLRYNPLRNVVIRRVLGGVDRLTCSSAALRDAIVANGGRAPDVVHPGVDPAALDTTPEHVAALRARLGLDGCRVILVAGRLTPLKGSVQLLRAVQRIFPDRPDARLLILTRASPEQQGLTDDTFRDVLPQIVMGGWLEGETLAAAYHLADAVAAPSICLDVFPTVNLEAMAAGKPVVATCFGGSPEAVADGATGHIVQPFDIAALSGSLAALLDDPERAAAMGAAGRGRFAEGFTAQHAAARMDAVCRSTVSGN